MILRKIKERNYSEVQKYIRGYVFSRQDEVYKKFTDYGIPRDCKKSRKALLKDYCDCLELYATAPSDYLDYGFYKGRPAQDTIANHLRLYAFSSVVNPEDKRKLLDDKVSFLKYFNDFLGREWLDVDNATKEEFLEFVRRHSTVIVKNKYGFGGKGTHLLSYVNEASTIESYNNYKEKHFVIEQCVKQTGVLHDLNPDSVNCLRICVLRHKYGKEYFQCFLNMGNGNACVDNAYEGGLFAPIDIKTGKLLGYAYDDEWVKYYEHPTSKIKYDDITIPYWNKALEIVGMASDLIPDLLYTSWDVAVSDDGNVYIIEGNSFGDTAWFPDRGPWQKFVALMNEYDVLEDCNKLLEQGYYNQMEQILNL